MLLCVSSVWFLWSNRQEKVLFGGEILFVLTYQCSWLLNVWPSLMLRSCVTSFSHIMGPARFPCGRCSPGERTHTTALGKRCAVVLWVKLQRNVDVSNSESSEQGKRTDVVSHGTRGQIRMLGSSVL